MYTIIRGCCGVACRHLLHPGSTEAEICLRKICAAFTLNFLNEGPECRLLTPKGHQLWQDEYHPIKPERSGWTHNASLGFAPYLPDSHLSCLVLDIASFGCRLCMDVIHEIAHGRNPHLNRVSLLTNEQPPGPFPWPICGNTFSLPDDKPWYYFEKLSKDYNSPLITFWLGR